MSRRRVALIVVLLVSCLACNRGIKSPPQELLGVWTTDVPAYQGRYLKFEKDYVLFGVGQDASPTIQPILSIDVRQDGKQTVYTVHSVDADGAHEFVFFFDPSDGGALRIKNQREVVWRNRG
ncbi:MAG: hypothetical protein LAN64_03830 [Acidobacteriia bacterium]|nr:hypothetical protein [Terriglobia bacterium]